MLKLFKKAKEFMLAAGLASAAGLSNDAQAQAPYERLRPAPTHLFVTKRPPKQVAQPQDPNQPADRPDRGVMVRSEVGRQFYAIPDWGVYSIHYSGQMDIIFGADNGRKNGVHFTLGTGYRADDEPYVFKSNYDSSTMKGFAFAVGRRVTSVAADGLAGLEGHVYSGYDKRFMHTGAVTLRLPIWRDGKTGYGTEITLGSNYNFAKFQRNHSEMSENDRKDPEKKIAALLYIGVRGRFGWQKAQQYDELGNKTGGFWDQPTKSFVKTDFAFGITF